MQRTVTVTCPSAFSAVPANTLYGLILAVTGIKPTDGIIPDRCCGLNAIAPASNAGTVTLEDFNGANTQGPASVAATRTTLIERISDRNSISLRDYYPVGSQAAQVLNLTIDYK